jgi:hypothetical protein
MGVPGMGSSKADHESLWHEGAGDAEERVADS